MARTTLIIDVRAVKEHISALIKESFENVVQHINAAIASYTNNVKGVDSGIGGLREQIIANVQVLLPIIGSNRGLSISMGNRFAVVPNVHVITVGQEPKIKAYILQGGVTGCDKFIDADESATTVDALKKLLILTQSMLEFHIDEIGTLSFESSARSTKQFDATDAKGWDSNMMTNPAVTFNFNGRSSGGGSDASFDSAAGGCDSFEYVTPRSMSSFSDATTLYDFGDVNTYYTY